MKPLTLLAALALLAPLGLLAQTPANPIEAQLRDALRSTTAQLRTAQGDVAASQAEKAQALADLDKLTKRLEALEKKAAADRDGAKTAAAVLDKQLAAKNAEATRLADRLKATADALDQAQSLAATREEKRAALDLNRQALEREVAALRGDNRELFRLGSEILTRYENYGLGRALLAREPFTKLTRVKLQNLVQDYADALEDHRAKLPPEPTTETAPPAPASS